MFVQFLSWLGIVLAIDGGMLKQQSCGLAGMCYAAQLNGDTLFCKDTYIPVL